MAVSRYGPGRWFGYVFTAPLTFEIWPWPKVVTSAWTMDNNWVKYYLDPTWQWGVMARTMILSICVHSDIYLWEMTLVQGHDTPLGHGKQLGEILTRLDKGVRSYGPNTVNRGRDRQTDRQDGSYIPQYFVCGDMIILPYRQTEDQQPTQAESL